MVEPLQESMFECARREGVDGWNCRVCNFHSTCIPISGSLRGSIIGMAIFPGCVCLSSRQSYR